MSEAVSKNDADRFNQEYKETVKYLLDFIFNKLRQAGIKTDSQITIKVGTETVYQSQNGKEPVKNTLTKEEANQIRTALKNPQQFKGLISIFVDNKLMYSVKNGQVLTDLLQPIPDKNSALKENNPKSEINPQPSPKQETSSEKPLEATLSQEEQKYATLAKIQIEINSLGENIQQKQKVLSSLTQDHPDLKQELLEIKEAVEEQKESLNQILGKLREVAGKIQTPRSNSPNETGHFHTKIKDTFGKVFNRITRVLTPDLTKLQTQTEERLAQLESQVADINQKFDIERFDRESIHSQGFSNERVHDKEFNNQRFHNALPEAKTKQEQDIAAKQGQDIAAKARELLGYEGKLDEANNSVDLESKKYLFIVKDKILSVSAKDLRGEVLNDKGFTIVATEEDKQALERIEAYIEGLRLQQTPLKVTGLKM